MNFSRVFIALTLLAWTGVVAAQPLVAPAEDVAARQPPPPPPPPPAQPPVDLGTQARLLAAEGIACLERQDLLCAQDRLTRAFEIAHDPQVAYALVVVADARGDEAMAESYLVRVEQHPNTPTVIRAAAAQRRREANTPAQARPAPRTPPQDDQALAAPPTPEPVFTSDRPGYANSTSVAALHRATTEFGFDLTFDDGIRTLTFPTLSMRVGLTDWLEFRLKSPNLVASFIEGSDNQIQLTNTTFGFKLGRQLTDRFAISLVPEMTIPTSGGTWQARLELNWSASFGVFGLGGNFAFATTDAFVGRDLLGEASLAASIQATDALGIFVQTFMLWTRDQDPRPYFGGGLYAQVHPRIQVDATVDVGLTDDADSRVRAGAGMTVLWD